MSSLSIDITLLEKLRQRGDRMVARCPACAIEGGDRRGDHLFVNLATRQWGCAARSGDHAHRQEIFAQVGIKGERPPVTRQSLDVRRRAREEIEARDKLIGEARKRRAAIVERWRWDVADVWEDSPTRIDQPLTELDPRFFIGALFPQESIVWTGADNMSGTWKNGSTFPHRWKTVSEWQSAPEHTVGPMISPSTWPAGTFSRTAANVLTSLFVCLDYDGFDGIKPSTPKELREHVAASLSITRWLREGLGWRLAAIVWTGSKSIHAWFHTPPPAVLQSLKDTSAALGIDSGLIGDAAHPCRLPGQIHEKTRQRSRVLWLQNPIEL
jgi:hypothetical protein